MKAAVFHKPGEITYDTMPDPRIELATDIILKVTSTAICGSDLGTVSIMGVYGSTYDNFPLHRIFDKGVTLKMGQAPVLNYIDHLIDLVKQEKVVLDDIITHTLPLSQVSHAYQIFNEKEEDCVKVVLKPGE